MTIYTSQQLLSRLQQPSTTEVNTESPVNIPAQSVESPTLGSRLKDRFNKLVSNTAPVLTGDINGKDIALNAFSSGANVVGGVNDIVQAGIKGITDTIAPDSIKQGAIKALTDIASYNPNKQDLNSSDPMIRTTSNSNTVKDIIDKYAQFKLENPKSAELLSNVFDIGNFIATVVGGPKVGGEIVNTTAELPSVAKNVATDVINSPIGKAVGNTVDTVGNVATDVANSAKNIGAGTVDLAKIAGKNLARIPERTAVNVAEQKATETATNSLPTQVAQNAVRDGVDLLDAKYITDIPQESKPILKNLLDSAIKFENSGRRTVNPIEVVGEPMVNNIKIVDKKLSEIGKQLNEVSKTLPSIPQSELINPVLTEMKKTPGLEGLKLTKDGKLDFKDTALTTNENSSARNNLQDAFLRATKYQSGTKKNLLRQELFDILGGKMRSLSNLTSTEENGIKAIRKGLLDVLTKYNPQYGELATQYAKTIDPLEKIKDFIHFDPNKDKNLLNLSAGIIARRLTSNAPSQSDILQALRDLDKVAGESGVAADSVTAQHIYNILDRYYNIGNKTGYKEIIASGVEKANGVKDFTAKSVQKVLGKTDAVRKKAFENLVNQHLHSDVQ